MFRRINQALTIALVLCAFQLSSASSISSGFTIKDYVPKDFTDLSWTVRGGVSGSASRDRNDKADFPESSYFNKGSSSTYSFDVDNKISYLKETLADYMKSSLEMRTYFKSRRSEDTQKREDGFPLERLNESSSNYSSKSISVVFAPQIIYKKFTEKNYFYALNLYGRISYNRSLKNKSERDDFNFSHRDDYYYTSDVHRKTDREDEREDYQTTFDLSIGSGRLYAGKYAFIAYNIIQELLKEDLLIEQPDKKMMIALTEIIYQYENSHTIDVRLKTIDKYDAIYTFLLKNKVVKKNSHKGMLLVQDAFEIYTHDLRRFGFSKSIGLGVTYFNSSRESNEEDQSSRLSERTHVDSSNVIDSGSYRNSSYIRYTENVDEKLSKFVIASLVYSKPINMKWQVDASANGKFYFDGYEDHDRIYITYTNARTDTSKSNAFRAIDKRYELSTSVRTSFFYSSRTVWRNSILYNYTRLKIDDSSPQASNSTNRKSWNFQMNSILEYRLSIPTTLRANIRFSENEANAIDNTRFNFSLSLLHYLY